MADIDPPETARPMTVFTEALGRRMRTGSWEDQKVSTYRKIIDALGDARWDDAATLGSYFVDEAQVCFSLYRQWIADLNGFLTDCGVDPGSIEARNAQAKALAAYPDGSPFEPRRAWDRFLSDVQTFMAATYREHADDARRELDRMKETWRQCHDRDVDHTYALMSLVKEQLGEAAIRDMFERILLPLFAWRYEKFDIDKHPWDESLETLMLVACEAMRGHLVGPDRTGDMELVELDDRFVLRFDPCGSGGRVIRGDPIDGSPPRMQAPYNWTVTEDRHSWNHYTPGICLYCTHCIILMEEMAIDRFGYPVRVVDPPIYDPDRTAVGSAQKCQWIMFKDPTAVPTEFYERVGRVRPAAFGSVAQGARELPVINVGLPGAG